MIMIERIDDNFHRFMTVEGVDQGTPRVGHEVFPGLKFIVTSTHLEDGRVGVGVTFIFESEFAREKILGRVIAALRECHILDTTFGEIIVDDVVVRRHFQQETISLKPKFFGLIHQEITAWAAHVAIFGGAV